MPQIQQRCLVRGSMPCCGCGIKTRQALCDDCRRVLADLNLRAVLYEVGRTVRQMRRAGERVGGLPGHDKPPGLDAKERPNRSSQ